MISRYFFPLIVLVLISITGNLYAQGNKQISTTIYKNAKVPIEDRVKDLLSKMTPEEKFWQLFMVPGNIDGIKKGNYKNGIFGLQISAQSAGSGEAQQMLSYNATENAVTFAKNVNQLQRYVMNETRLGIPMLVFDEALHGLIKKDATAFPQSIGLAASFDTLLIAQIGRAIAKESKIWGIRDVLAPVINMADDVRWGRVEETYGEDPYLTTVMGLAFMNAIERENVVVTPKHFIANVGDGGRDSYPIEKNNRFLEEIHFPAFKEAVKKAKIRSIMTSYNSVDGTPATSNHWLLTKVLKDDWGFKGFVISDAGAVGGANVLHNTASGYHEATVQALNGGLDVIFQVEYQHYKLFMPPFLDGSISSSRIDDAVSRVLRAKFELGLFENPYVSEAEAKASLTDFSNKKLAKKAALASFVLLKNDKNTLPLKQPKNILVLGEDAVEARLGGYSGTGKGRVNILDGIKRRAGSDAIVNYTQGSYRLETKYVVVDSIYLSSKNRKGLAADYFNTIDLSNYPIYSRVDKQIDFVWTLYSPNEKLQNDNYSVKWQGEITAPKSGTYKIGLEGNDGYRLFLDGKLIIDQWDKLSYHTRLVDFTFEANKAYTIKVEFNESKGNAHIKLIWNYGVKDVATEAIEKAISMAKKSDLIVLTAGIKEGEFLDRAMLNLPGNQETLIKEMAKIGKPIVIVLVGGSAINMHNWIDDVDAILNVWYPGEEGGDAVAETLYGDFNPGGRLPITYPVHEAQLPLVYNHKPTGRGDDYNNLSGEPLFPFGYGKSYTKFKYSGLKLSKENIKVGETVSLRFKLKNEGSYNGEEVVQMYIRDILSSVSQPVLALKNFQRIFLKAGEEREIVFELKPETFQMLNKDLNWEIEPGQFRVMIGSSSKELLLKETITLNP
jgi:beta-glucosidase